MAGSETGCGLSSRSKAVSRLCRKESAVVVGDQEARQILKADNKFSTSSVSTRNLRSRKPVLQPKQMSVSLEAGMDRKEAVRQTRSQDKALGNALVVGLICSFISSRADFRALRLVNHVFQEEVTKRWKKVQGYINLNTLFDVQKLILLAQKREALHLTPFPFSSFEIDIDNIERNVLKRFSASIGRHVNRYFFNFNEEETTKKTCLHGGGKIAILLSRSHSLTEIEIQSNHQLFVSDKDLLRITAPTFPHLSTLTITIEETNIINDRPHENDHSLLDILVNRSAQLKRLTIPGGVPGPCKRILRFLLEKRLNNLPSLSFDKEGIYVNPSTVAFIRELIDTRLMFTGITLNILDKEFLSDTPPDENDAQNMINVVVTWLKTQSNFLTNLHINFGPEWHMASFPFPTLAALKNLRTSFPSPKIEAASLPLNSKPVLPIVGNPFPVLEELRIDHYRDDFAMFGTCSMPSVQKLDIRCPISPVTDPSLKVVFSNLTFLNIEIEKQSSVKIRPTLAFILTHLTRVVHLNLDLNCEKRSWFSAETCGEWNFWDILTGEAPRSVQNYAFSVRKFVKDAGEAEKPLDGVYGVPSLRNMTALKTFSITPRLRINIDAILYMSRAGFLVPLDRLTLKQARYDIGLDMEHKKKASVSWDRHSKLLKLNCEGFVQRLAKLHKEVMGHERYYNP